ncbi:MAG: zinc ribbon domain-containing protein [Breznakibacter sp.]
MGYAIIAVPTGIVTSELAKANRDGDGRECSRCRHRNPQPANYCDQCGEKLAHAR